MEVLVYKSDELCFVWEMLPSLLSQRCWWVVGLLGCYVLSTRLQTFRKSQTSAGIHHSSQRNIPENLNLVLFIWVLFYEAVIVAHCIGSNGRVILSCPKIGFNVVLSTPRLPRGWSCKSLCVASCIRDTCVPPQASFKYAIFMSLCFRYFSQDFATCSLYSSFTIRDQELCLLLHW